MTTLLWIETYLLSERPFWLGLLALACLWAFFLHRKLPGLLVMGPLVAVVGLLLVTFGPVQVLEGRTVESWIRTSGEVTRAEWQHRTGTRLYSGGSTFEFRYRYSVDDRDYVSERYSLGTDSLDPEAVAVGQEVTVFYNPLLPARAVLSREHDLSWGGAGFMMAIGTLLLVSGTFQTRAGWQEWRARRRG